MPFHKRPPRGYTSQDFPLPHNFEYHAALTAHSTGETGTILTLFRAREMINMDTIVVNPKHGAFAEETGPTIANGSIVPKVMINMHMNLTKIAIETDKLRQLDLIVMPIYTAFLNSLEADDNATAGTQVEDILELQHGTGAKVVHPLFNGSNLGGGTYNTNHPMNTVLITDVFGNYGLTTDIKMEGVTFDYGLFLDALHYFSNQGMLRKVAGKMMHFKLTRDNPKRFYSGNFTYPMVKRGNNYTFCGLLIYLPQVGTFAQYGRIGDTSAADQVDVSCNVRFDEWNDQFDQTEF